MNVYSDKVKNVMARTVKMDNLVGRTVEGVKYISDGCVVLFEDTTWLFIPNADSGDDYIESLYDLKDAELLTDKDIEAEKEARGSALLEIRDRNILDQETREREQLARLKAKYE